MRRINPMKAALALGGVLGLYHLTWTTLVLAGLAQPILDFILRLHFINLPYEIAFFNFGMAGALVVLTFTLGALFGLVFAAIWNWLSAQATEMQPDSKASQDQLASRA